MKNIIFMPTPFMLLKGVYSGAEERGIVFGTDPVGVGFVWFDSLRPINSLSVI